uniref:coiled-coil domain-containing protein 60-like isoform X2 n=1 Tax=Scatophagus argus TaxID=75038 RepID=UPI001ED807A6|nr:coiled-coil domain-containing protein 60-like isoform X2 [Scatophagus argus]
MTHSNSAICPRRFCTANPAFVSQYRAKVCALSSTGRADFHESKNRRQLLLSRRQCCPDAPWRPSEGPRQPSYLETKAVILDNMGQQHLQTATTDDPPKIVDKSINSKPPDSTGGSKSLPVGRTQAGKRADIVTLRKHLGHARRMVSAIKRGQSYLHLLQKQEQEEQETEERQRMRREELLRTHPRPPSFSSDSDSDSEGWPLPAGNSWSGVNKARPYRKKSQPARHFAPVHHSLTSPLLSEAPGKVIYRQLCCLNWLLEALTLDRSSRVGPLTACWDPRDPGRGRTTIKTLKKERAIENKWEQFVSTKPRRAHPRRPRSSSAGLHTHRKSSSTTVASLSALTSTTVSSSVSSLVPAAEENTESPGAAEKTEWPPSEGLCTVSDVHQKVKKESQGMQTGSLADSCHLKHPLDISHLINSKATMLREMKAAFDKRVEEIAQSYVDVLELKARERWNSGVQRYRAMFHMADPYGLPHHVTCMSQETKTPNNNNKYKNSNNMWLSTLLSSLPEEVCREQAVSRVLEKLRGFAEQQTLRIATEHVVQMSREEYDAWLHSRVTLPPRYHRAPQTPACTPSPLKSVTSAGVTALQQLEQTLACLWSFTGTTESTSEKVRALVYDGVCVCVCVCHSVVSWYTEERKRDLNTGCPLSPTI